jgi:hypothetical protein
VTKRSSNDQKSDAHNPTSKEYKDRVNHRSRQLNPTDKKYHESRKK